MTTAYVGNRKNLASDGKSFNTENHIAKTLEKLGHTVNFIQEDEIVPGTLIDRVREADLFLWTRTWKPSDGVGHVSEADLVAIRALGIPSASFHLDKYTGILRDGGLGEDLFWKTDYVFSPEGSPEAEEIFKNHGINHVYLKPGVYEDECYIAKPVEFFDHDIVFVGGGREYSHPEWKGYRNKLMDCLESFGPQFVKYGWPQETVRGERLNQLYSNTKIIVGDSLCKDFTDTYYWSDRVYETIGRGGFLIHPYIKGLEEEFTDGENIVFYNYNDFDQLKRLINYYLEHDEERERIRLAGHEFVKNHATYTQRLTQMLNHIFPAKQTHQVIGSQIVDDGKGLEVKLARLPIKISLGAGTEVEEGFVNVDIVPLDGIDVVHNLMQYPWPFADNSAEFIKAKDVIEHMATHLPDGRNSVLAFIDECHRILQPGGTLWIQTPSWQADFFWIDPTHVRPFDIRSMDFFDPDTDFGRGTGFYSQSKFKVSATQTENNNLVFEMSKR